MGKHDVINRAQICNEVKRANEVLKNKFSLLLTTVYVAIEQDKCGSAAKQTYAWEVVASRAEQLLAATESHKSFKNRSKPHPDLKTGDVLIYPFAWRRTASLHSMIEHKYRPAVVMSSNADGQLAICPISSATMCDRVSVSIPEDEGYLVGLDAAASKIIIAECNIDNLSNIAANLEVNHLPGRFSTAFVSLYRKEFRAAVASKKVRVLNRFDEPAHAKSFAREFLKLAKCKIAGENIPIANEEMDIFPIAALSDAKLGKLCDVAQQLMYKLKP
jgi:hypothetical protein